MISCQRPAGRQLKLFTPKCWQTSPYHWKRNPFSFQHYKKIRLDDIVIIATTDVLSSLFSSSVCRHERGWCDSCISKVQEQLLCVWTFLCGNQRKLLSETTAITTPSDVKSSPGCSVFQRTLIILGIQHLLTCRWRHLTFMDFFKATLSSA